MAYETGSIGTAAGDMITVLDAELVVNSHWSIHDASAGTNAKTYKCQDSDYDVLFYVHVDNNQTSYAKVRVWEDWNATSHAGSGKNTAVLSLRHDKGTYGIAVRNHNFVWINSGGTNDKSGYYVGELVPAIQGDHHVVVFGHVTTNTSGSPLTTHPGTGGTCQWLVWADKGGTYSQNVYSCSGGYGTSPYGNGTRYIVDTLGYVRIQEEWINCGMLLLGYLDGVMCLFTTTTGLADGDTVAVGSDTWEKFNNGISYPSFLLRK